MRPDSAVAYTMHKIPVREINSVSDLERDRSEWQLAVGKDGQQVSGAAALRPRQSEDKVGDGAGSQAGKYPAPSGWPVTECDSLGDGGTSG